MANTILTFKKYIDQLDDVYKLASKTAVLETPPALITQGANAGEFVIPKLDMDGDVLPLTQWITRKPQASPLDALPPSLSVPRLRLNSMRIGLRNTH